MLRRTVNKVKRKGCQLIDSTKVVGRDIFVPVG